MNNLILTTGLIMVLIAMIGWRCRYATNYVYVYLQSNSDDIDNLDDDIIDVLTKNDYNVIRTDLDLSKFDYMTHISNINKILSKNEVIQHYKDNNEDELDTYKNSVVF